jgi:hypothetical protein
MSTLKQVMAAQVRMERAQEALQDYLNRPEAQRRDHELHKHLAERLKRAADEYLALVIEMQP